MLRTEVRVYEGVIDACRGDDIANRYGRGTASGEQLVRGVEYGSHYGLAALRSRGLRLADYPSFRALVEPLASYDLSFASASAVKCSRTATMRWPDTIRRSLPKLRRSVPMTNFYAPVFDACKPSQANRGVCILLSHRRMVEVIYSCDGFGRRMHVSDCHI